MLHVSLVEIKDLWDKTTDRNPKLKNCHLVLIITKTKWSSSSILNSFKVVRAV